MVRATADLDVVYERKSAAEVVTDAMPVRLFAISQQWVKLELIGHVRSVLNPSIFLLHLRIFLLFRLDPDQLRLFVTDREEDGKFVGT